MEIFEKERKRKELIKLKEKVDRAWSLCGQGELSKEEFSKLYHEYQRMVQDVRR